MAVGDRFIRFGTEGEILPVVDCYPFMHDFGNGKFVLRITIADNLMSIDEMETMFSNADNLPIFFYEIKETSAFVEGDSSNTTEELTLVNTYEDFCKALSYSFNSKSQYEIEIDKKLDADVASEYAQSTSVEIMETITELI